MKALIIDDEPPARMIIREYLQDYPAITGIEECGDGFEGLKAIQREKPGLLFLDIQMPKITGFEMLELAAEPPPVIFTTAFDEYAIKAFESRAVDYLLKPFSKERFDNAMQKLQADSQKNIPALLAATPGSLSRTRVVVRSGSKIKIIAVRDILYLEAADDYVKIHTTEGSFLKNRTMAAFEDSLDAALFVRSHRSYIVNVQEVARIDQLDKDSHGVVLRNGESLPVSRSGYGRLRAALDI